MPWLLICERGSQKKDERDGDECELAGVELKRNPAYVTRDKTVDFQLRQWFSNPHILSFVFFIGHIQFSSWNSLLMR